MQSLFYVMNMEQALFNVKQYLINKHTCIFISGKITL